MRSRNTQAQTGESYYHAQDFQTKAMQSKVWLSKIVGIYLELLDLLNGLALVALQC